MQLTLFSLVSLLTLVAARQEWRTLSATQQQDYLAAVKALHERAPGGTTNDPSTWNHEEFAIVHEQYYNANHNQPGFFPWHRLFLVQDWTIDAANIKASPVLSSFGNQVDGSNCVSNGVLAGWTLANGNCIKRNSKWDAGFGPAVLGSVITSASTFKNFQDAVESPHGLIHNMIGGNIGDFSYPRSPNEPIFFLHHAFVDKLWWLWQKCAPANANAFSSSSATNLPPFGPVSSTFTTSYTYTESVVDQFICPDARGVKPTGTTGGSSASPTATLTPAQKSWLETYILTFVPNSGGKVSSASKANLTKRATIDNPYYTFPEHFTIVAPSYGDSTDLLNMPHPAQWPDWYIAMMEKMGMSKDKHLQQMAQAMMVNDRNNNNPGFTSPAAPALYRETVQKYLTHATH
ncbi:hypothetical protein HDU91_003896 [Kappamyces sp. JEL0680]|nr:hypothetical protein HDU91_003896 [Kappamyces sp. JEL0680]